MIHSKHSEGSFVASNNPSVAQITNTISENVCVRGREREREVLKSEMGKERDGASYRKRLRDRSRNR